MKKKQINKKNKNKKIKTTIAKSAFENLETKVKSTTNKKSSTSGIPKYVADRMARRIFFTTGIPTILGMSVFVVSYVIVTRNIAEIPPSSTIAISALFFLLGLVGLSYGILSIVGTKKQVVFWYRKYPFEYSKTKSSFNRLLKI